MERQLYELEFNLVDEQIGLLEAGERALVLDAIERHLSYEPHRRDTESETDERGQGDVRRTVGTARPNLRVYYGVEEPERTVVIAAVGRKDRARVRFGKRWIKP